MRQPDIEIYLKDAEHPAITTWLSGAIGPCSAWQQKGQTYQCVAGNVPVTWLPRAVGKWHSLLLDSDATPWNTDRECARAAFAESAPAFPRLRVHNVSWLISCFYRIA